MGETFQCEVSIACGAKNLETKQNPQSSSFLFPKDLPSDKQMDISARYIARHEVSGDYYDFFQVNEDEYIIDSYRHHSL